MRDAFLNKLYEIALKDRNVILICADMGAPSLDKWRENLPEQYYNVGIAEQNMVAVATGLALSGKKVYTYAIIPFATLRCYELIKVDISLMNLPITIIGVGSGFSYHESGPTHHATEDISVMRALPNMTIFNASDEAMATKLAEISYKMDSPCYIRLDREGLRGLYRSNDDFSDGLSVLEHSGDVCIMSTGNMINNALEVRKSLYHNCFRAGIVDFYRIKPVNKDLLLELIGKFKRIVTIEEHLLNGGIGSIVAEIIADNNINIPLKRFGIDDQYYYAYGSRQDIQKKCGLDAETISKSIMDWLVT